MPNGGHSHFVVPKAFFLDDHLKICMGMAAALADSGRDKDVRVFIFSDLQHDWETKRKTSWTSCTYWWSVRNKGIQSPYVPLYYIPLFPSNPQ